VKDFVGSSELIKKALNAVEEEHAKEE